MSEHRDPTQHPGKACSPDCAQYGCGEWTGSDQTDFDYANVSPGFLSAVQPVNEVGAIFEVEHLASGSVMGLGPMSPALAAKVAATWRGRKRVQPKS